MNDPGLDDNTVMEEIRPWEFDGLPTGVHVKDFQTAETFFMTGIFWWGRRLIPVHPERHGFYFDLSGTQYEHNIDRLARLVGTQEMYADEHGKYFPAVLLPDPSEVWSGRAIAPVAVCSLTGYLGSAWQEPATALRPEVDDAYAEGKYMITRIRLVQIPPSKNPTGWAPKVWLPCDQLD